MSTRKYKLMYFDARGGGETARMLFSLKGEDFEDYRFAEGEWPKLKPNTQQFPLGQAPVLLINGEPMPQSKAIARYLAREFGYYGSSNREAARIDVICETIFDIQQKLTSLFYEKDEEKKEKIRQEFKETSSKPFFTFLDGQLEKGGGKYFVGSSITLADMTVFNLLDFLIDSDMKIEGVIDKYPALGKFYKGIKDDSPLTSYLKSRPVTKY